MDNNERLVLPKSAVRYALFQRVHYLPSPLFKALSYGSKVRFLHKPLKALQAILFSKAITEEYCRDTFREFETIKAFLPNTLSTVLDIGCGIAGLDVFISRHYHGVPDIFLLDKTKVEKHIFYSYFNTAAFYNSLTESKKVLITNGVPEQHIHSTQAPDDGTIPFDQSFSLVVSLTAWGYHFPVATYLDAVYEKLQKEGIVMLDVRYGTNGIEEVKNKFGNVTTILASDEHKYHRIIAKK